MKKICLICMLLLLLFTAARAEGLRIVEASDLHYLSPALVQDRDTLMRILRSADGKMTHCTPNICRAFVDQMLAEKPDAVLLSGDLTLNGSRESHEELITLLRPLREAGIPVLVIPGNHDVTGIAYRFTTEGAQAIDGMEPPEFLERYADFGYADARSRDETSFSYLYELSPQVWLLAVDVNSNIPAGSVQPETLEWIAEQLAAAQDCGARVIAMSHQSLLVHFPLFTFGYQLNNAKQLAALYEQYGVRLNLSGHLHLQHIAAQNGVTEIATSALSVWPHHYAEITLSGGAAHYAAKPLDVSGWARAQGLNDPDLLHFDACSARFFDDTTCGKLAESVSASDASEDEKAAMLEYARVYNRSQFAGYAIGKLPENGLTLWERYLPKAFFTYYMSYAALEPLADMREAAVDLDAAQ